MKRFLKKLIPAVVVSLLLAWLVSALTATAFAAWFWMFFPGIIILLLLWRFLVWLGVTAFLFSLFDAILHR